VREEQHNQFAISSDKLDAVKHDTQLIRKYVEEQSVGMRETLIALEKLLRGLQANDIERDKDLGVLKEEVEAVGELVLKVLMLISVYSNMYYLIKIKQLRYKYFAW